MIRKVSILLSLLVTNIITFSQPTDISAILKKHCILFSNPPKDYSFLDSVVQNKRFIFLGEKLHNDAGAIEKKTEIIKYLIENHDFQAVIFEGGIFETEQLRLFSKLEFNKDILSRTSFFNGETFYYNEKHLQGKYILGSEIEFAGLDIAYGNWLGSQLRNYLYKLFKENGRYKNSSLRLIDKYCNELNRIVIDFQFRYESNNDLNIQYFLNLNKAINEQLKSFDKTTEVLFMEQVLKSDAYLVNWIKNRPGSENAARFHVIRDSAMANNLTWLINTRFKGRKVVVSTSTYHQFRSTEEPYAMVSLLPQDILNESLFLPIIWYKKLDKNGNLIRKQPDFSLESYLSSICKENCFLSFSSDEVKMIIDSLTVEFSEAIPKKLPWSDYFDGVIFIETMKYIDEKPITLDDVDYFLNVIRKK